MKDGMPRGKSATRFTKTLYPVEISLTKHDAPNPSLHDREHCCRGDALRCHFFLAVLAGAFPVVVFLAAVFTTAGLAVVAFFPAVCGAGFDAVLEAAFFLLLVFVFFPNTLSQLFQNSGVAPVRTIGPLMILLFPNID